jgi:CheY-like chemotaxis protein
MVRQKTYDIILMDMQMPVMDGLTATRIIRKELQVNTPIIALTAFATKEAIDKALESGMNGYMTKPFEEETLYGHLLSAFGISPVYVSDSGVHVKTNQTGPAARENCFYLDKLSKMLDNNTEVIIDIIDKFIQYTPEYSTELFTAFEQNNMEEVAKAAHKIKSSLELLASGNLRSNIVLIHDYSNKRENLEKLPKLIKYLRDNLPVMLSQLGEKVEEMRRDATT